MIEEDEENSDPKIQAKSANTDPIFQVPIQTECKLENQKIESSSQFPKITTLEQAKSELEFQIIKISSTNQAQEKNSVNSEDQKQEDEDALDERSIYCGLEDWNAVIMVQRPPPEPPDLKPLAVRIQKSAEVGASAKESGQRRWWNTEPGTTLP
ncbi:hypothetical protein PIB30_087122 [Stylosanthes scabra]|uniref:Uncharacterized protein n=1 Tax=Stylosanthes scabra TaxID=79078 RepID=A0ABU6QTV0_9FABA|nr:hypothetical protein [Stylosanthes scabra]